MPWYKFEVSHGSGHQSKVIEYKWYDEELSERDKEFEWKYWLDWDWDWPIGEIILVEKLPKDVYEQLILDYSEQLVEAKKMLEILRGEIRWLTEE